MSADDDGMVAVDVGVEEDADEYEDAEDVRWAHEVKSIKWDQSRLILIFHGESHLVATPTLEKPAVASSEVISRHTRSW